MLCSTKKTILFLLAGTLLGIAPKPALAESLATQPTVETVEDAQNQVVELPRPGENDSKGAATKSTGTASSGLGKKKKTRRRGCSSFAEPRYRKMVRNWQVPPKIPKPKYKKGYRDLVLYSVNKGERIRLFPFFEDGTMDPEALNQVKHLLRDKDTDEEHAVHPRLLKLLYRVADKLNASQITVISGYRAATEDQKESKHRQGAAVDFMVPGKALGVVAKLVRTFGRVGVGFYPVSGFVHMDVRDGPSYFWLDRSGPGKPSCMRRIFAGAGDKYDRKWKADLDEPVPRKTKTGELLDDETLTAVSASSERQKKAPLGKKKKS